MYDDWGPRDRDRFYFGRDFAREMGRFARDFGRRWGPPPGVRAERFRGRMFGRGDLKFVILDMLRDQPRHGYDIIRELEGRFGGFYTPSAGVVYPTLQMLEDMGAVTSQQQDGRKMYTITEEGRRILEERRDTIDDIADRVKGWMRGATRPEVQDTMREMGELMALLAREGGRLWNDPERLKAVRETIAKTRSELEAILRTERI